MAYRFEQDALVIDGFEKGIASSPYTGIANMRNVGISYYPSVAYVNYRRQPAIISFVGVGVWFAGSHSVNVSGNAGWLFFPPNTVGSIANPIQKATSPAGLNYVLDSSGQIFKQNAVNSGTFTILGNGGGRLGNGAGGLAFWNNYLIVFGDGFVEFCGDGTGDAGIISSNWNVTPIGSATIDPGYYSSFSIQYGDYGVNTAETVFSAAPVSGDTSANLTNDWWSTSGTYNVQFSDGTVKAATFTNGSTAISWTGMLPNDVTVNFEMYTLQFGGYTGPPTFNVGDPVTFSVISGALPAPLAAATTYYLANTVDNTINGQVFVSATPNGAPIGLTSQGTGSYTMTDTGSVLPLQNNSNVSFEFSGDSLSTMILKVPWNSPTGIYNIVDPDGNNLQATFTLGEFEVALLNPAVFQPFGTHQVNILNPLTANVQAPYRAYVSKVDGNLYFANGRWVGRLATSNNINANFNPGLPITYSVSYAATGTLQSQDTVVDMIDLRGQMIISGNYDLYPWDYVSAQPSASTPVGEQIYRSVNLLNNVYILAGQKGNIYVSNGASAQCLYKLPDFISGVIDPIWSWGDLIIHRAKLYLQAFAQSTSGSNLLAGVFSFNVSATLITDVQTAGAFNMEAQNSTGLIPASGSLANGVLMDNEPSSNGQDSYYSAYSTGASTGAIDYNDTSLWQNNEPVIETDIIPIGTYLQKATFGNIEFKLDRPLATGDSLSIYWRPSLSASYVSIPLIDTSANLLSSYAITSINQAQWAQFKVTYKCASSNSSFIPLREIRLYVNQQ